jgi:hypothetical protein
MEKMLARREQRVITVVMRGICENLAARKIASNKSSALKIEFPAQFFVSEIRR